MFRLSVIALFLFTAGCTEAADRTFDRTFTVSPGGTLNVDADGASVHVSGNDSNKVVVHMVFGGTDMELADLKLDAVQTSDGVTVTMRKKKRSWFSWGTWGKQDIEVTVPRQYAVNVHTGGGSVDLRDTVGAASLHSSGGSLSAKSVTGNVEMHTSGGSIDVDTIRGDVDADTSGGSVHLLRVDGKIRGNTSGGSVRVSLVGANRGISATTSGGGIELILPKGTTANIDATTSGGSVKSDIPVSSTESKDKAIVGSLNGGGETIYAHTSGGSISLRAEN